MKYSLRKLTMFKKTSTTSVYNNVINIIINSYRQTYFRQHILSFK